MSRKRSKGLAVSFKNIKGDVRRALTYHKRHFIDGDNFGMPRTPQFIDIPGDGSWPPAHANQALVTATMGGPVDTTAAINTGPYGYTQTQANAIILLLNALQVDVTTLIAAHNQIRTDLVEMGFVRGGA